MKTLLLLIALVVGHCLGVGRPTFVLADAESDERAAASIAAASKLRTPAPTDDDDVYCAAYCKAVDENKPLVVFVACQGRYVTGCIVCSVRTFADLPSTRAGFVVVSKPVNGKLLRIEDMSGLASDEEIQDVLSKRASLEGAFSSPVSTGGPARLSDSKQAGSLPDQAPSPVSGVGTYAPARFSFSRSC